MAAGLPDEETYRSTGHLPPDDRVSRIVARAHAELLDDTSGECSDVYPALREAEPDRFGIALVAADGTTWVEGDAGVEFTLMSVAKPFVFALVCQHVGADQARRELGANATGLPFNSIEAIERTTDGTTNPMVNPGAIAAASMAPGATPEDRWRWIRDGLSRFAGRELGFDEGIFENASRTNHRNRELVRLLERRGRLHSDASEALDRYTRQACLLATAEDLAVMGATLADGGVNPRTGEAIVDATTCHHTLAVMATAGLYETSGDWLYQVGLPGKSGISGGIVTVSPGKGGLGTFSPRLDAAGNSVRGRRVAQFLSGALGLDLFGSRAVVR